MSIPNNFNSANGLGLNPNPLNLSNFPESLNSKNIQTSTMDQRIIDGLNKQINLELLASQYYLSMYIYCSQSSVGLSGFSHYFLTESGNERNHALQMIKYLIQRGGVPVLSNMIAPPSKYETALKMIEFSREMEKQILDHLVQLEKLSADLADSSVIDFLSTYINEQHSSLYTLDVKISQMKLASTDTGLFLLDQSLLK